MYNTIICSIEHREMILRFLESADKLLPTPISDRIPLTDFADKLLTHGIIYGMIVGDRLIGGAFFYCNDEIGKTAYLSLLAVLKEYHHCGVGNRFVSEMEQISHESGMTKVILSTSITNYQAIAFYKKHSYNVVGQMTDCNEEKYLMMMEL